MSEEFDQLKSQELQQPNKVQDQKDLTAKKNFWKKIFVSSTIISALLIAFLIILFLVILPSQQTSYVQYEDESIHSIYDPQTKQEEHVKITRMKYVHRKSKTNDDDMDDGEQFQMRLVQTAKNGRQLQQEGSQQNSPVSCLQSDIQKTTTYVYCDDGQIQILNQDLNEVFTNNAGARLLLESLHRTLLESQNTDNSTSNNPTSDNTTTNVTTVQLDNGLEANIYPANLVEVNSTVLQTQALSGEVPIPENNSTETKRFLQMFDQNVNTLFHQQYSHLTEAERIRMLSFLSRILKPVTKLINAVSNVAPAVLNKACHVAPVTCKLPSLASPFNPSTSCRLTGLKNYCLTPPKPPAPIPKLIKAPAPPANIIRFIRRPF